MSNSTTDDFKAHLIATGRSRGTAMEYAGLVRRFLKHVGETRIDRISEELSRSFFATIKGEHARHRAASIVSQYLKFTAAKLPVVVNGARGQAPRAPVPTKQTKLLRERWHVDKLIEGRHRDADIIAQLARKVIDHYVFFEGLLKGEEINLDDVARLADEAKALIEANLALFMSLSAGGRNVHSKIDERVSYDNGNRMDKGI